MVISDKDCRTAQTQVHTIVYAISILPGPPVARAFPVAIKTPLPILDPREIIFLDCETMPSREHPEPSTGFSHGPGEVRRSDGIVHF